MTDAVRVLSGHVEALRQPDVFKRSVYLTCEIDAACEQARQQAMAMKIGRITRSIAGMKAASEALERHLNQAAQMNATLRAVLDREQTAATLSSALQDQCAARQAGDAMTCAPCNLQWDTNDVAPPRCRRLAANNGGD